MIDATPLADTVTLLECNLDDMTGEALGYVLEQALNLGALDAWHTAIVMKKGRPASQFSLLCRPDDAARLRAWLLRETTTLGVRWTILEREIAARATDSVQTPWGPVRRKLKIIDGVVVSMKPEYEDCARIAREQNLPLQQVIEAASQQS